MVEVRKNGIKMAARDNNQLSAFLNNGWTKVEEVAKTTSSTGNSKTQKAKE